MGFMFTLISYAASSMAVMYMAKEILCTQWVYAPAKEPLTLRKTPIL